jgi:hypothetical protein
LAVSPLHLPGELPVIGEPGTTPAKQITTIIARFQYFCVRCVIQQSMNTRKHKLFFAYSLLLIAALAGWVSCTKYKDKKGPAFTGTNHYCNDPNAANYNWGFPGIPDSTVCIYPTDLFAGKYQFIDSVFLQSNGYFIFVDTFTLTFYKLSLTKLGVTGFCSTADTFYLTAGADFVATVDTLEGDSITNQGQKFCVLGDTVNGTFTKDRIFDSLMYLSLQVISDTGAITNHIGTAKKIN